MRPCVPVLQPWSFNIFSNFLHEVSSPYDLDDHQKVFGQKEFWHPKWPKMVKIWPFLAKIAIFECFWPISSKRRYKFSQFLVRKLPLCSSLKNHSVYAGKILRWPKFGHLWPKIWPFFCQNWQFWRFMAFNFQTLLRIFLIFGMEVVLMVLFEKIILYIPGKFWYGEFLTME